MHKHSLPATEVSVTNRALENGRCQRMMAVYLGKGCWLPIYLLFNQLHCLCNLCIPQYPHLEGKIHFLYLRFHRILFFSPWSRDDGILEPFIIKRHNRNIHFASVGIKLTYTIKLWYFSQASSVTVICVQSWNLQKIWRPSLSSGCSYSLLALLGITDFTY